MTYINKKALDIVKPAIDINVDSLNNRKKLIDSYIESLIDLRHKCGSDLCCEHLLYKYVHNAAILNEHLISRRMIALSSTFDRWSYVGNKRMARKELARRIMLMDRSALQINDMRFMIRFVSIQFAKHYSEQNMIGRARCGPCLSSLDSCSDDVVTLAKGSFNIENINKLPTRAAYNIGKSIAEKLMERYYYDTGKLLRHVAVNIDAISSSQTGGIGIAVIMCLVGARPV